MKHLYRSTLKIWNLDLAKASGFDPPKEGLYYNIGLFSGIESQELLLRPKNKFSLCSGILKFCLLLVSLSPWPYPLAAQNAPTPEELIKHSNISEWETLLEYARVLSYMKKYDESIAAYQKLLKEKPDFIKGRLELAKVYYYDKKYDEAREELSLIPHDKKSIETESLLADIYTVEKDYPMAVEIYRMLLTKNPQNDSVRLRLAEILSWQKKYEASLKLYRELVVKHPDDIQLRRHYGMVLIWAGHEREGAEELKKTL